MPRSASSNVPAYQLRIQLGGVSPPIWRRVLIPTTASIRTLHAVIQASMGWENIHLNQFTIRGQNHGVYHEGGICFRTNPDQLRLCDFGFHIHDRFLYEYDFYSEWLHDIRIEKIRNVDACKLPRCIVGRGFCPPEDSGPIERFMTRKDSYSVFDFLEWLDDTFDDDTPMSDVRPVVIEYLPWLMEWFDRKAANGRLQQLECYSE